eukprot:1158631-Pelagomonas_calceolata.AAC.1
MQAAGAHVTYEQPTGLFGELWPFCSDIWLLQNASKIYIMLVTCSIAIEYSDAMSPNPWLQELQLLPSLQVLATCF